MHVSAKIVEMSMVTNVKLKIEIYWFLDIDVAGGAVGIEPSSGQEQSRSRAGRWIAPLFFIWLVIGILNWVLYEYKGVDIVFVKCLNVD